MKAYRIVKFDPEWPEAVDFFEDYESEFLKCINKYNKNLNFTSSGKTSLYMILKAFNIKEGDEVILPCYCCGSLLIPIKMLKIKPIAADIDMQDLNISKNSIKQLISSRTKAVIVPSLYGNPANLTEIIEEVGGQIKIIDDAAQAFDAKLNDRFVGTFGNAGFWSFGVGKQISSSGGSFFWADNTNDFNLKRSSFISQMIQHYVFLFTRVNLKKNQNKKLAIKLLSKLNQLINSNKKVLERSMGKIDANVGFQLIKSFEDSNVKRKKLYEEISLALADKPYIRLIKNIRGESSPNKIVICIDEASRYQAICKILQRKAVFYSTGYELICAEAIQKCHNAKKIKNSIIEIPLSLREKEYLLETIGLF
ncbi:MAG: DegT/DnrJ/EryC1/StrS family aminotransferase [Deltaproteobacteria bacterium]